MYWILYGYTRTHARVCVWSCFLYGIRSINSFTLSPLLPLSVPLERERGADTEREREGVREREMEIDRQTEREGVSEVDR